MNEMTNSALVVAHDYIFNQRWKHDSDLSVAGDICTALSKLRHQSDAVKASSEPLNVRTALARLVDATEDTLRSHSETECCTITMQRCREARAALTGNVVHDGERTDLSVALWWAAIYREKVVNGETLSGYERSSIALTDEIDRLNSLLATHQELARNRNDIR